MYSDYKYTQPCSLTLIAHCEYEYTSVGVYGLGSTLVEITIQCDVYLDHRCSATSVGHVYQLLYYSFSSANNYNCYFLLYTEPAYYEIWHVSRRRPYVFSCHRNNYIYWNNKVTQTINPTLVEKMMSTLEQNTELLVNRGSCLMGIEDWSLII